MLLVPGVGCGDDGDPSGNNNANLNQGVCGDGVLNPTEECDEGEANSDVAPGACRTDCRSARCGDGVADSGEACDGEDLQEQTCEGLGHTSGTLVCGEDCQLEEGGCTDCGNGRLEAGEACDGSDFGTQDCASTGAGQHGTLHCLEDCTLDSSGCHTCGDGTVEPAEACEPSLPLESCQDLGLSGGQRWCIDCQIFETCSAVCGNAELEAGEECDGPDLGGITCQDRNPAYVGGSLRCSAGCLISEAGCSRCGNGVVDAGEQCDGTALGSGSCGLLGGTPVCTPSCRLDLSTCDAAPSCGNGALETSLGEQCDGALLGGQSCATVAPGVLAGGTLACGVNCLFDTRGCETVNPCGNGAREPTLGEQCDGGDLGGQTCQTLGYPGGSLACSAQCTFHLAGCEPPPSCGNSVVDHALEQCDGNDLSQQSCLSLGFVGGSLGCTGMCLLDTDGCYVCGNGRLDPGELCDGDDFGSTTCADFGKNTGGLRCSTTCDSIDAGGCSTCGDGLVSGDETCDDGDAQGGDGCSSTCQVEPGYVCNGTLCATVCGDGIVAGVEQCDDGNLRSHDGCSSACTNEVLQWVDISPSVRPPQRMAHNMAFDPVRDRIVLHGGIDASGYLADTWEFDGAAWEQLTPSGGAGIIADHCMAWDPLLSAVLLMAGDGFLPAPYCSGNGCNALFSFAGVDWTHILPPAAPPFRKQAAMAFDVSRGVVVLFGGAGATLLGDTWEYDGTTWTQVSTPFPPPARYFAAMAYDSSRARILLFGGGTGSTTLSDLWEFTALGWVELSPANAPAVSGHRMVYDEARDRIVTYSQFSGTWEYDPIANAWAAVSTQTSPTPRSRLAMVYDSLRRRVVLFGGNTGYTNNLNDTWSLSLQSGLPDERCTDGTDNDGDGLVDCADPDCDHQLCSGGHCVSGTCQ